VPQLGEYSQIQHIKAVFARRKKRDKHPLSILTKQKPFRAVERLLFLGKQKFNIYLYFYVYVLYLEAGDYHIVFCKSGAAHIPNNLQTRHNLVCDYPMTNSHHAIYNRDPGRQCGRNDVAAAGEKSGGIQY
jgi:hypothetical protein